MAAGPGATLLWGCPGLAQWRGSPSCALQRQDLDLGLGLWLLRTPPAAPLSASNGKGRGGPAWA